MRRHNWLVVAYVVVCLFAPLDAFSGTENLASFVPGKTPDGWMAKGKPQVFTKESLFEHIDGQADLFLQYGFQRSVFAVYRKDHSDKEKIDLDIYDMGDVVQAFGIFSRFRQEDHAAGIGLGSYLDDGYALFYKGKYFVVLQATESNPPSLKQLAGMIASRIADGSPPPKEIQYFPKRGLKPGSIEYYPQGLMGRQFLGRGFKATYVASNRKNAKPDAGAEDRDANLFLAIFDNPDQAEHALITFKEDLSKRGSALAETRSAKGLETMKGEDPYQGKLNVVRKSRYLAGAAGFENENDAQSLLADLIRHMQRQVERVR